MVGLGTRLSPKSIFPSWEDVFLQHFQQVPNVPAVDEDAAFILKEPSDSAVNSSESLQSDKMGYSII